MFTQLQRAQTYHSWREKDFLYTIIFIYVKVERFFSFKYLSLLKKKRLKRNREMRVVLYILHIIYVDFLTAYHFLRENSIGQAKQHISTN